MPKSSSWINRCQPFQIYVVLALTVLFFITELVVSHLTHALTLLMDSYHMLCNIIALTGCIITIKHSKSQNIKEEIKEVGSIASSVGDLPTTELQRCSDKGRTRKLTHNETQQEDKMKNTFGWARIDVIVMLICCVFLASLSFSILVEALQTLFHIDHQHEMHRPIFILCIGAIGLLLNGVCYLLIGGYTFHQGSFLYVTESGDVVLDRVVTNDSVRKGERRLSRTRTIPPPQYRQRQGLWEMARDIIGCVFVIICSIAVYFTEAEVAKFIDPIISLLSAMCLMILSYPYMKESCFILLQTIPDTINIDSLKNQLIEHFPDIVNVHDLHIWQLTANKVISTAHIIFQNPKVYAKITNEVKEFFLEHGITQVTIQPEFFSKSISLESLSSAQEQPLCLMKCHDPKCIDSHCCPSEHLQVAIWKSREFLPTNSILDLKSINLESNENLRNQMTSTSIEDVTSIIEDRNNERTSETIENKD